MSYNFINFEISNMTSIISFNRPEVYNALNKEAKLEILKALEETEKIKNIGAIIITGEGKAFCTGQDLNDRSVKANEEAVDLGHTLETEWNPLVNFIKKSKSTIEIGAITSLFDFQKFGTRRNFYRQQILVSKSGNSDPKSAKISDFEGNPVEISRVLPVEISTIKSGQISIFTGKKN